MTQAASLHVIKSISQRALVRHWRDIAADRRLPSFDQFAPPSRAHDPRQLMFWTIEGNGAGRRFRTLHNGKYLTEAFGMDPPPLQLLQSVVPPELQQISLEGLHACADVCRPFYMIIGTKDDRGHDIDCERLLLPFGDEDGQPRQIVASLQLISVDGHFTRETVLARFAAQASTTYAAQIILDGHAAANSV